MSPLALSGMCFLPQLYCLLLCSVSFTLRLHMFVKAERLKLRSRTRHLRSRSNARNNGRGIGDSACVHISTRMLSRLDRQPNTVVLPRQAASYHLRRIRRDRHVHLPLSRAG